MDVEELIENIEEEIVEVPRDEPHLHSMKYLVNCDDDCFQVATELLPEHSICRILVVCMHAPTKKHAGGLRILDMLHKIKTKCGRTYIEVFTSSNAALYDVMGELSQIADSIVLADNYNFSLHEYLRKAPTRRYFDIVDFQFQQPPELVQSYRNIGRKLLMTPMESYIRNECITRGVEVLREGDLTTPEAIEEAALCRLVDQTVCVSDMDRAAISGCVKAHVTAIETGVSEIEFAADASAPGPDGPVVCFVAYFGSETNRQALKWYLEKVHPRIHAAVEGFEFRVIGRGKVADILEGAPAGVTYVGEVEHVSPHIRAAMIGIAPALSGSGFRGKINQYAHLGVPCVATRLAADGMAYEHGRSIMVSDDPDAFADHIIYLLENPEARIAMGEAAAEVCLATHGWESKWPAIADAYDLPQHPNRVVLPSVHAVVPSYRHAEYIEQRLRSIFEQEYPHIRVTVIDDCSTDGSHEKIEALRQEFEFEYIRNEVNSGSPFNAWEYAANNTAEDLIWICESDDFCDRTMVGKLVREITMRRKTKIAYCASTVVNDQGEALGSTDTYLGQVFHKTRWDGAFAARGLMELLQYQRFGMVVPNMSSALIDADVFRKAYSPDIKKYKLAGDWLFMGLAMQFGDIAYVPDKLNSFRKHENTSRADTSFVRRTAEHLLVRLTLSELAEASEHETIDAIRYDLHDLFTHPEQADEIRLEMRKINPEAETMLAALLRDHFSGKDRVEQLEMKLELVRERNANCQ